MLFLSIRQLQTQLPRNLGSASSYSCWLKIPFVVCEVREEITGPVDVDRSDSGVKLEKNIKRVTDLYRCKAGRTANYEG